MSNIQYNSTGNTLISTDVVAGEQVPYGKIMDGTAGSGNVLVINSDGSLNISGTSASGAANSGNPLKVGAVFNTTQPTVTTGQVVDVQATNRGALIVATGVDAFTVQGTGANGAATAGNPFSMGLRIATANPTSGVNGNNVRAAGDKAGRLVTQPYHIRELVVQATTTITTTTETTIAAAVASTFNDLTAITIANSSAAAVTVSLRDTTAGTVRATYVIPPTDTIHLTFPATFRQTTANTNWTLQLGAATTSVFVTAHYVQNL